MTQPIAPGVPRAMQPAAQAEPRSSAPAAATPAPQAPVKTTRADSVSISVAARMHLAVSGSTSNSSISVSTSSSATVSASGGSGGPAAEAEAILGELRGAFNSRDGDDGFNSRVDFNGDGVVNVQDLAMLRQKLAGITGAVVTVADPVPPSEDEAMQTVTMPSVDAEANAGGGTLDALRAAFYTREGEDGFNADVDFNRDGVIDARDLGLARRGAPQNPDENVTAVTPPTDNGNTAKETLSELRAAFYAREGDEAYDSAVDFNNDGVVNIRDLAMARAGSVSGDTSFTQPVEPPVVDSSFSDRARALIQQLREAFFSSQGDNRFVAGLDANGDGRINVADLAAARSRISEEA